MTQNKKILVIGGNSFVGKRIVSYLAGLKYHIISTYHHNKTKINRSHIREEKLDITEPSAVYDLLKSTAPDIIIVTAALSSNSYPEKLLMKINHDGIRNIVESIKKINYNPLVIFFSTEQIFDGYKKAYTEKDIPKPINAYGKSKLAGENIITELPNYIILRCSIIFGLKLDNTDHDNFVTKVIDTSDTSKPMQIFNNVYRAPIFVDDIPIIIEKLISKSFHGIINMSGTDIYNYEQMYNMIKDKFNVHRRDDIVLCNIDTVPKRLVLDNNLLEKTIGFKATKFSSMLKKMKEIYNKKL
jgi:dTDP-4-dehydrorhamnose reductase